MTERHRLYRRWGSVALLLLIMAGLVSQWPERGLWYDETVNAYFAGQSWSAIWDWCTQIDNQVPLHFALLKLWGSAAGTGEFALRVFSALCAILSAAGLIALGQRIGGSWAGWLAAAAFALSQGFLYAAFEVRPYALALALLAWSNVILWMLWDCYAIRDRPFDRRYWLLLAGYWLLALALLYTHYTAFLALAAHGAYVGWRTLRPPSRRKVVILAHLGTGLALGYLPWILALAGRDVRAGTAYDDQITPWTAIKTYANFFAYGQNNLPTDSPPYALGIAGLVIGAFLAIILLRRREIKMRNGAILAALLTVLPVLGLMVMVHAVQAKLSGRHGWVMWLGATLVIGLGLAALTRWRYWQRWPVWIAALVIIWLPTRADLQPVYNSYLREACHYIEQHAEPGDVLVLRDGTLFTAAGYYDISLPWIGLPPEKLTDVHRFAFVDEALPDLEALLNEHHAGRVWVLAWQGHIMDPQNLAAGILETIGEPLPLEGAFGFGDVSVSLYRLHNAPRALADRLAALEPIIQTPPDGPVYYGGYVLNPVQRGGMVQFHTWWQRGATVMSEMRISTRLYDSAGTLHAQIDQPPVGPSFGQENWRPGSLVLSRFALPVPPDMPPGPAEVRLILYDMAGTFEPIEIVLDTIEIAG